MEAYVNDVGTRAFDVLVPRYGSKIPWHRGKSLESKSRRDAIESSLGTRGTNHQNV